MSYKLTFERKGKDDQNQVTCETILIIQAGDLEQSITQAWEFIQRISAIPEGLDVRNLYTLKKVDNID